MTQSRAALNNIHQSYADHENAVDSDNTLDSKLPIYALHSFEDPNSNHDNNISMYFYPDGSAIVVNSSGMEAID